MALAAALLAGALIAVGMELGGITGRELVAWGLICAGVSILGLTLVKALVDVLR